MSELRPAGSRGYPIKLIRDRTTDIIGDSGDLFYDHIEPAERPPWLRKKLIEEVAEYAAEPGLDELIDVLAVVEALAEVHDCDLSSLIARMQADPRGGFLTGRMMRGWHPWDGGSDPAHEREKETT